MATAPLRSLSPSLYVLLAGLLGINLLAVFLMPTPEGKPHGYQARACGLDMNRNGIVGEPDDCKVCNGGPNHPIHPQTGTPDPDGDGIDEDFLYVDADLGDDVNGTGSALAPLRTLAAAWALADGPEDGAEDIVCFRGTSHAFNSTPPEDFRGLETTYTVPAAGSDARDWYLPKDPTLLVGWDHDNDGCYPPYDDGKTDVANCGTTADIAHLAGDTAEARRAFHLARNVSYLEMAHLSLSDYGRYTTEQHSGFLKFARNSEHQHLYFHDLELERINFAQSSDSSIVTIDLFNTNLHWVNFTNLLFEANGGWFVRGVPHQGEDDQSDAGPLRFKDITRRMHGSELGATTGFKIWGYITGVEVLDSLFDLNTAHWTPLPSSGNATVGLVIVQCNQDWVVRNNQFIDFWGGIRVDGSSNGYCDNAAARPTTHIVLDGNVLRNTYPDWGFGHYGISIQGDSPGEAEGDAPGEVIGNITVSNNKLSSTGTNAWDSCISANPNNDAAPVPGVVRILNNTCYGPIRRSKGAALLLGARVDSPPKPQRFVQERWMVGNNVVAGLAEDDHNIVLGYLPADWNAGHNVYDPAGRFALWTEGSLNGFAELSEWQAETGGDPQSKECTPRFRDVAQGDFYLKASDTCARDAGKNLGPGIARDIDGDPRPEEGPWDAGADQSPGARQ